MFSQKNRILLCTYHFTTYFTAKNIATFILIAYLIIIYLIVIIISNNYNILIKIKNNNMPTFVKIIQKYKIRNKFNKILIHKCHVIVGL